MSLSEDVRDALPERVARHPVASAVLAITIVALAIRLVALDARIAHFDEGRMAHWALHYAEAGEYWYRPVNHGPFIHIVGGTIFSIFGASDFTARALVAVVGGLLPLSALLFRQYLTRVEVVAMATLLALDPVMLYYSRFFRNDIFVGGFAFVAFGLFLLAAHRRRPVYLYPGALALGLSFSAKENALVYVLCWLGAGGLVFAHALYRSHTGGTAADPTGVGDGGVDRVRPALDRWLERFEEERDAIRAAAARWTVHGVGAAILFLAVLVFFYAPRGVEGAAGFPGVIHEAIFEYHMAAYDHWVPEGDEDRLAYSTLFWRMFEPTIYASGAVLVLGVAGFVYELFARERSRLFVLAASYWGFASVVGYPLAASVENPAWLIVHVVLPLSIPAAVAAGVLVRWAEEAHIDDDPVSVALSAVILVSVFSGMVWIGYDTSFANAQSSDNVLVQYAQPEGEFQDELAAMERAAAENEGIDVLYYGERYHLVDEGTADRPPAGGGGGWHSRLPLPWYERAAGAETASERDVAGLESALAEEPPIVIAEHSTFDSNPPAEEVTERIGEEYQYEAYYMRAPGDPFVIYVHEDYVE